MPTITGRLLIIPLLRALTHLLCRIDAAELEKVPQRGPLLIATNHTGLLEIPILYTQLQPRPFTGMVAAYRWQAAWSRWILENCNAIPIQRGELDMNAVRRSLAWLGKGGILAVAPEGTRSYDGVLRRGHGGVILLAEKSVAPILPVAFYGAENFTDNLRHMRRSDFHIRVGEPITIENLWEQVSKQRGDTTLNLTPPQFRQAMADEVMRCIAALLPEAQQGIYKVI